MVDFSIGLAAERIYDARTREVFREVQQSMAAGSLRSAVVMLWTVVICDLVYKLQELRDLYGDPVARTILDDMEARQQANPKSPEWEGRLVEEIAARTQLLDPAEKHQMVSLQSYRHLCAHPVLSNADLLFQPSVETVRAYTRSVLESVLLKPPMLSKRIADALVVDIAARKQLFPEDEALRRYLEAKYLGNLREPVENGIFRALWKFVFSLSNPDVDANRDINYRTLCILFDRRSRELQSLIHDNQAYFSQVIDGDPLRYLRKFLSRNPSVYKLLSGAATSPLGGLADTSPDDFAFAWFLSEDLKRHLSVLVEQYRENQRVPSLQTFKELQRVAAENGYTSEYRMVAVAAYGGSNNFDTANSRFEALIDPILDDLAPAECEMLLREAEGNDQISSRYRTRAQRELRRIVARCSVALGSAFDLSQYPNVHSRVEDD